MGETALKLISPKVADALFRKFAENKEQVSSINGELGERLQAQYENNSGFTPFFWATYKKVRYKGVTNELQAREMIELGRAALDMAEAALNANGHVGDLVDLASQPAAPSDALTAEQATEAFEKTAHLAPFPAEVDAKVETKKRSRKPAAEKQPDSVDQYRASLKVVGGTDGETPSEEAALDADFDDLAPPAVPAKPKAALPEIVGESTYKIVG